MLSAATKNPFFFAWAWKGPLKISANIMEEEEEGLLNAGANGEVLLTGDVCLE